MGQVISDGLVREQFTGGTLESRAAYTESALNAPMSQLRNGTRTETREVLEEIVWKYCITLMIYVPYNYIF